MQKTLNTLNIVCYVVHIFFSSEVQTLVNTEIDKSRRYKIIEERMYDS